VSTKQLIQEETHLSPTALLVAAGEQEDIRLFFAGGHQVRISRFPLGRLLLPGGGLTLALAVTSIVAFGADNSLGTWKMNMEKSKYTGAPMPVKALTTTREASDGGVKVTLTGEQSDGTAINSTYTSKHDGKEVSVTGNAPYDMIAIKQVNANTLTDERHKMGGPYKATGRMVISNGGKTMTSTTKGANGEGKGFTSPFVFDKQ
jgi:hypothetical protein